LVAFLEVCDGLGDRCVDGSFLHTHTHMKRIEV
jgi:hypothetical protein